jgi:hypothetical protein
VSGRFGINDPPLPLKTSSGSSGHPAAVGLGPVKLMILPGQHRCDSVVSTVRFRSRLVARNEAGALVWAWLAEETMGRPLVDLLNSAPALSRLLLSPWSSVGDSWSACVRHCG